MEVDPVSISRIREKERDRSRRQIRVEREM